MIGLSTDNEGTKILGAKAESLYSVGLVIMGLLLYSGPIVAGTLYLQNLYNAVGGVAAALGELKAEINPRSFTELRSEVDAIKLIQNRVIIGETKPQIIIQENLNNLNKAVTSINDRCGKINERMDNMQRQIDKNAYRVDQIFERKR